jgi:prepilin-type cleavage/methylation N-terminal domain protein
MRKLWKKMKNKQGFTLMEMLIVVAIIAVLVAIAIPVYQGQVHKAKVAADWANLRAYYAELQLDYQTSGIYNYNDSTSTVGFDWVTIPFLNGSSTKLQAGTYLLRRNTEEKGYEIIYNCSKHCAEHTLHLNPSLVVSGG